MSVFVCNLVTYKVDLSAFQGMNVRFVIHDNEEGNGGFGFVFFDELNTYYASEEDVPKNATLAENLLADKVALKAELALEVAEQGDFTLDSYNAYLAKLGDAKALAGDNGITVSQARVDEMTAALKEARLALQVRPVIEVEGANKSFNLISGDSKEISLAELSQDEQDQPNNIAVETEKDLAEGIFDFEENSSPALSAEEKSDNELHEIFEETTTSDLSNLDIFDDFGDFDE